MGAGAEKVEYGEAWPKVALKVLAAGKRDGIVDPVVFSAASKHNERYVSRADGAYLRRVSSMPHKLVELKLTGCD